MGSKAPLLESITQSEVLNSKFDKSGLESDENDAPNERLARLVRLAARAFNRSLQIRLSEHNISFGQWIFLRILWQNDGVTQRDLSELANLTEPTTHTSLLKLENQGLIIRKKLPGDKRRIHTFLSEKGRKLRQQLEPMAIEVNRIAVQDLNSEEETALRDALKKVIHNLEADEHDSGVLGRKMPPTRANHEF